MQHATLQEMFLFAFPWLYIYFFKILWALENYEDMYCVCAIKYGCVECIWWAPRDWWEKFEPIMLVVVTISKL